MAWEAIVQTVQVLLALFGAIACIAGGVTALAKLFAPLKQLRKQVADQETKIDDAIEEHAEFRASLELVNSTQKMLCLSMFDLLEHEISGNHVDRMKKTRDRLNEFIIDNNFNHN